jgi:ribulose-5-phosphate 4-epimerase/fuculose-1-phosphate aldolase
VLSRLGYHDYEGLALNEEEKPRLVRDLGDKNFLMLRNHGLLTAAASIADEFAFMYFFETSCMTQVREQSGGSDLIPVPQPFSTAFGWLRIKPLVGPGPASTSSQARSAGPVI